MNSLTTTWWILFAFFTCLFLVVASLKNPQFSLGISFALSLLVPSWLEIPIADNPLPFRLAVQAFAVGAYCFFRKAVFPLQLGLTDLLMISLVLVHIVSDSWNSGWKWTLPLRAYCEWGIPYVAGRLCFSAGNQVKHLSVAFTITALVLATLSLFEAITHHHPWEIVFGERPLDGIPRNAERWGMLRSWGQSKHPIFLGLTMVLLQPWNLSLFSIFKSLYARILLGLSMVLSIAGIASTGSRAAILASLLLIILVIAQRLSRLRFPIYSIIFGSIVVALIFWDQTWRFAHFWSGEESYNHENRVILEIDGERLESSSTMGRLNFATFYKKAMWEGGLLGFGTERTSTFPVDVPLGIRDEKSRNNLKFVDNHYILITLRFGWLGCAIFTATLLFGSFLPIVVLDNMNPGTLNRIALTNNAIAVLSIAIALLTVWLAFDFGQIVLFYLGTLSAAFYLSRYNNAPTSDLRDETNFITLQRRIPV